MQATSLPSNFLALSAEYGNNPLTVQGPGGNTSIKIDNQLWIKASGRELAAALDDDIFVAVKLDAALAEAHGAGDGTCRLALFESASGLRPSIETTFHAAIAQRFVFHTHSVAALIHATSEEGLAALHQKLDGLHFAVVPYCKPGRPLTEAILQVLDDAPQVIVLQNHGLIVAADDIEQIASLMAEVSQRLSMPQWAPSVEAIDAPPDGYRWHPTATALAIDSTLFKRASDGAYYPDHVVFLGVGLGTDTDDASPAVLIQGRGVALRLDITAVQLAMVDCFFDVLARTPASWTMAPLGLDAVAELLNWDAEKYRQALAAAPPAC